MLLRMGLPQEDSQHQQILHEGGHLQPLPCMILLAVLILLFLSWPLYLSLAGLFLLWEILSEGYVVFREKDNYLRIYRRRRKRLR